MTKLTLIYGDALKVLPELEGESVNLIIADPPYNIGKDYGIYKDNLDLKIYFEWCEKWLIETLRLIKKRGSLFVMNYPENLAYLKVFLDKKMDFINWITWIRNDNQLYNKQKKFKKNHQDILFYAKNKEEYYFDWKSVARIPIWHRDKRVKDLAGQSDTWNITYVKGNSKEKTKVNNQLPLKLINRIIQSTSAKNDIVLDPFLGSGTTMKACLELNRDCIGIEINKKYIDIIKKRLNWNSSLNDEIEFEYIDYSRL